MRENSDLDHIIIIKLTSKIITQKYLLTSISNLKLVYKSCYKNKTFYSEEQQLSKNYRKTRKSLIPENSLLSMLKNEFDKLLIYTKN